MKLDNRNLLNDIQCAVSLVPEAELIDTITTNSSVLMDPVIGKRAPICGSLEICITTIDTRNVCRTYAFCVTSTGVGGKNKGKLVLQSKEIPHNHAIPQHR